MTRKYPDTPTHTIAVMAGSFNPFTVGHLSVLRRGLAIFSKIVIFIGMNPSKAASDDDDTAERAHLLSHQLSPFGDRVEVRICRKLTAVAAKEAGAVALLRGVRSVADFEYERNMADLNRRISGLDTILLFSEPQYAAISSSAVRELQSYGMDVSQFLPPNP